MVSEWISGAAIVVAAVVTAVSQRVNARIKELEKRVDAIEDGGYATRLALIEREVSIEPQRRKEPRKTWPH
jgi:hypothetical protein